MYLSGPSSVALETVTLATFFCCSIKLTLQHAPLRSSILRGMASLFSTRNLMARLLSLLHAGGRRALSSPALPSPASVEEVNKGIADVYDETTVVMETLWGDHMHHGFFDVGVPPSSFPDHRTAQIRMIEEALRFAGVSDDPLKKPKRILDVGCGIGGSSLYLAKKYGTNCLGINLSPFQIQRAQSLAISAGLADKVSFEIADAQNQPYPDGHFDLVWVVETAEHMADKPKFVGELARVTAPGGIVIMTSWCHRNLLPSEDSLRPDEVSLLNKLSESHHLPKWCSPSDYVKLAEAASFKDIKTADWTEHVAPHWKVAMRPVMTWKGIIFLLRSGWKMAKGMLAMPLVSEGREKNIIKYAVITFRKPE